MQKMTKAMLLLESTAQLAQKAVKVKKPFPSQGRASSLQRSAQSASSGGNTAQSDTDALDGQDPRDDPMASPQQRQQQQTRLGLQQELATDFRKRPSEDDLQQPFSPQNHKEMATTAQHIIGRYSMQRDPYRQERSGLTNIQSRAFLRGKPRGRQAGASSMGSNP